jgi:hypothetical protein
VVRLSIVMFDDEVKAIEMCRRRCETEARRRGGEEGGVSSVSRKGRMGGRRGGWLRASRTSLTSSAALAITKDCVKAHRQPTDMEETDAEAALRRPDRVRSAWCSCWRACPKLDAALGTSPAGPTAVKRVAIQSLEALSG